MCREENQLDVNEWFIAFVICSTCFGHYYAHRQELETVRVLLPHMVCNALVVGGRRSGAGQQAMSPGWGKLLEQLPASFNACYIFRCFSHTDHHLTVTGQINFVVAGSIGLSLFNVSVSSFQTYEEHMEKRINPLSPVVVVCSIKINI